MHADQIKDYPQFSRFVSTDLPNVANVKSIVSAMAKWSGASTDKIGEGLRWGSGPFAMVKALVPKQQGGHVSTPTGGYTLGTNEIVVSMRHVGLFQTGDDWRKAQGGQVHLVAVILLHELVHWARDKAGLTDDPDVEVGFEFEKQIYGWVIDR
jgi:hypothetical protein